MIALAIWAIGSSTLEVYRIGFPLNSLGLSLDGDGVVTGVVLPFSAASSSPAARADIHPGDRVDLAKSSCRHLFTADCIAVVVAFGDWSGDEFTLRADAITLFVQPQGSRQDKAIILRPAPVRTDIATALILLANTVIGILFVGLAFLIVWRQPNFMTWSFFLYAIWFDPGQINAYYALLELWPPAFLAEQVLEAVLQGAAYASLLAFAISFPETGMDRRWRALWPVILCVGAGVTLFSLASWGMLFGHAVEALVDSQYLVTVPLEIAAIVILAVRAPRFSRQDRQRINWAIAGFSIGLTVFLVAEICDSTDIVQSLFGIRLPEAVIQLLYLPQGLIAYFVGTAILRGRVVSIRIPLRRGAILTALTFLIGVPIVYLDDAIKLYMRSVRSEFDFPEWAWLAIVSPILLITISRLHETLVDMTERVFNRRYHRARRQLEECGQTMLKASDFSEVDRLLAQMPTDTFKLVSAAVFREEEGRLRRCAPSPGWADDALPALDPALDSVALQCLRTNKPQRLPRGDWSRLGLPGDDHAPCLAFPIRGGVSESVAVVLFGPHATGNDISNDEIELLRDFILKAAFGYDRAEVETLRRELWQARSHSGD